MKEPPELGRIPCRQCGGHGYVWTSRLEDGFERGGRWEECERCERSGYEPQEEKAPMIRVWRDTPKRGETDGEWFYSKASEGHIYEIRGGYKTEAEARKAAES